MSNVVVDSSVAAKWILPESDSLEARRLISDSSTEDQRLIVLDLVLTEVANAIWKRHHQRTITVEETCELLGRLLRMPVRVESSTRLLNSAMEIATRYDRAIYDALFVALAQDMKLPGVTADEPLWQAVHADFPNIILLRDWQ
jgi:predicted nucleic acid-binding protein